MHFEVCYDQEEMCVECGDSSKSGSRRLIYLITWFPVGRIGWEGLRGVVLLEVCHWGQALEK